MGFKDTQEKHQIQLFENKFFDKAKNNGEYRGKTYKHILTPDTTIYNLYADIRKEALRYFEENTISWWSGNKPTGNLLSSQIACLNHLMPIMHDRNLVLTLLKKIDKDFEDVLPIQCDKNPGFIGFEIVSDNIYLNEKINNRGANCTSIDAIILGKKGDQNILVAIEWKYTEKYNSEDKSKDSAGKTRIDRYSNLINQSKILFPNANNKVYWQEPFYQLMRQTLWCEEMIKNKNIERIKADDFIHIHVIPKNNLQSYWIKAIRIAHRKVWMLYGKEC
ncbi:MAG: hypothetical protein MJ204_08995 [Bacteroidales bacterium]|nr:hypothetical protein [Bacteroidales bacterium]